MVIEPLTVKTEMFLRQLDYLEDKGRGVLLTFDHGFRSHYEVVFPLLKARALSAVFFLDTDSIGKEGMLDFDEIKILAGAGFKMASHTISHPYLTRLPLARAKKEIEDSKKILEDHLGVAVDFFSYPYGDLNEEIVALVKAGGYKAAFLTLPWWRPSPRPGGTAFTLPRCGIYHRTNFLLFQLKLL